MTPAEQARQDSHRFRRGLLWGLAFALPLWFLAACAGLAAARWLL